MAHVTISNGAPGIVGLLEEYPETGRVLGELVHILLRRKSTLTAGERELIAAFVSSRNDCYFCANAHGSAAKHLLDDDDTSVNQVVSNFQEAAISEKLKALLRIAGKVQEGGLRVTADDVQRAREEGATDKEIHDTVLIAAAFCMFNRYVDGLATWAPDDPEAFDVIGKRLADYGYRRG